MKVSEIFNSIEGEGKRVGLQSTFIRLFGCNLRCKYCDSMYSVEGGEDCVEMSVEDIMEKVREIGCEAITITGGEPLIHKDIDKLLHTLSEEDYWVNVETNGSIEPTFYRSNIFYTVDFKTTASGETSKMRPEAFQTLWASDVIKCVVGSKEDLEQSLAFLDELGLREFPNIYVSPVFGEIEPKELVEFVRYNKLWNWRVQLQIHKIIWNPEERGV